MDKKAAEIMGESVEVGVSLLAQEAVRDMTRDVAGGWAVGRVLAGAELKPASLPGDHNGIFYVAVGPTKVGFFAVKRGFIKNSLDTLLVEHSRDDVHAVEIESGVMPTAHFVFQDGTHYAFKCDRMGLGKVKKIQALFVTE